MHNRQLLPALWKGIGNTQACQADPNGNRHCRFVHAHQLLLDRCRDIACVPIGNKHSEIALTRSWVTTDCSLGTIEVEFEGTILSDYVVSATA